MTKTLKLFPLEQVILDTIFNNMRDLTPTEITDYLRKNPSDIELIRTYIKKAEDTDYHPARLGFLKAVKDTYL